jgi:hypothetical protein
MSARGGAARVSVPRTVARTTADRLAGTTAPKATAIKAGSGKAGSGKAGSGKAGSTKAGSTTAAPKKATPSRAVSTTSAARPALRVVPSVPVQRAARAAGARGERRAPFVLLVVAMLVVTTIGLLVLSTAINVNSMDADDLRAANAELAEEVQTLQQEVVDGGAPAALAAAATAAGLVPAGSAAYLVISPDGSSTLRGTAAPAPEPVKPSRVPAEKD